MSASMRPTLWPSLARATARLTERVVLPTPPLPEPMATMLATPGRFWGAGGAPCAAMVELLLLVCQFGGWGVRWETWVAVEFPDCPSFGSTRGRTKGGWISPPFD